MIAAVTIWAIGFLLTASYWKSMCSRKSKSPRWPFMLPAILVAWPLFLGTSIEIRTVR